MFLIVFVLFGFFMMSGVLARDVCIDTFSPEAPETLSVDGNVELSWSEAFDEPNPNENCADGIEYYNVYLNGRMIGSSLETSFSYGALDDGDYIFGVSAVDLAGNEGARASVEVSFPLGDGGSSSGGGSSSSSSGGGSSSSSSSSSGGGSDSKVVKSSVVEEDDDSDDGSFESTSIELEDDEVNDKGFLSLMTGAVIGGGVGSWLAVLILIGLVVVLFFVVRKKRDASQGMGNEKQGKRKVGAAKKKVARKSAKKKSVKRAGKR